MSGTCNFASTLIGSTAVAAVVAALAATSGTGTDTGTGTRTDLLPAAATAATTLKLLDWNVQGGTGTDGRYDFNRVADVIAAEKPDIVTLQELHNNSSVGGDNQWQVLLDRFPQYKAHFAQSDANAVGGVAGNLILSTYPIKEKLTYLLPQYPSGTTAVRRSLGGVALDVGGTTVRVYTTHLSAGFGTEATERRDRQARAVIEKISGAALMPTPMIFTGDLNVRPDDKNRPWYASAGWNDTWTDVNANIGSTAVTHPGDGLEDSRIDYVYATPAIGTIGGHTVSTTASDHRPVVTELTVHGPVATSGAVLAGIDSDAGWANLAVSADNSTRLRVCDNRADGWGVRAYVYAKSGGGVVRTGADGAYADSCGTFTTAAGTVSAPVLKICLYKGAEEKECRQRALS